MLQCYIRNHNYRQEYRLDLQPKETGSVPVHIPADCVLGAFAVCTLMDADGYEVAMTELVLPAKIRSAEEKKPMDRVEMTEDIHSFRVKTGNGVFEISKDTGDLVRIRKDGHDLLAEPVRLTVWRAPTDNERNLSHCGDIKTQKAARIWTGFFIRFGRSSGKGM